MHEWIGRTVTSDVGWDHLAALTAIDDRMAGTAGERRAAEATAAAFRNAGAHDVRLTEVPVLGWSRVDSRLTAVDGDHAVDAVGLPRSPSAGAVGPLVDVGHGLPSEVAARDVDGAVALASTATPAHVDRAVHRREKYRNVADAGAAGFVLRNDRPGCLAATGAVGTATEPVGPIPAVGVGKEAGGRLLRHCEGAPVRVEVEADVREATTRNVHAAVGPETGGSVLFTSHLDAHDLGEGAMDNGAGTAMLVEVAAALRTRDPSLDRAVEFVAFGAEEVGLVGSKHHADHAVPADVAAVVNVDGVVRGRTLRAWTHGFDALEAALRAAADAFDHPVEVDPRAGPPGDQWPLARRGVPAYFVASERDASGRGWGHTAADTLDKLDPRNLREQALVLSELAVRLATGDRPDPITPGAALERFAEAGYEGELRAGDEWPLE
jgi:Zn-dependent M28 family amino/carboxypeptidase